MWLKRIGGGHGVGGGVPGEQVLPQKFWFVENRGKMSKNLRKIPEIKSRQNPSKCGQKWCPILFVFKKWRPALQKNIWRSFLGHTRKGLRDLCGRKFVSKCHTKTFRRVWGSSGKNPSLTQKFACSYTYERKGIYHTRWKLFTVSGKNRSIVSEFTRR